ncbi:MAG: AGE family epimerase/isomerase [Hyphomicrobiales bacterium]|nr:AGE family epimerase/isomerase [Hyphomicrobiales bacterium]
MPNHSDAQAASARLTVISGALKAWLIGQALPFWATAGRDAATGAFRETLLPDTTPDMLANQRTRVQARQIYVYAHAGHLGWFADGGALALAAFDRLTDTAREAGKGGFAHLLAPDFRPVDTRRDSYDHAFMVLAFAWCWRATGEARVRQALDDVIHFIASGLTLSDGSLREDDRNSLPRRQNPHMHMVEAMLALTETGVRPDGVARADRLLDVVVQHFLDQRTGMLGEFFDADLRPAAGHAGQIVEPGHMAEWVWLLHKRAGLASLPHAVPDIADLSGKLLANALATVDPKTGLLIDEASRDGAIVKSTRRLWPQTELAKAWTAQAQAGVQGAADKAAAALERLFETYIRPAPAGAWIDQVDADGQVISSRLPASSFYHVFVAILEADAAAKAAFQP